MRQYAKYALVAVLIFLVGFGLGYGSGWVAALNWGVHKAVYFLELKGIKLDIDEKQIVYAINQYKNQIDVCYPGIENALVFNKSGN